MIYQSLYLANVKFQGLHKSDLLKPVITPDVLFLITANAQFLVLANEDRRFMDILKKGIVTIDGQLVYWLLKCKYPKETFEKIAGSDLIYECLEYAQKNREKVFLLGADELSNRRAVEVARQKYPDVTIFGYSPSYSPYPFSSKQNETILGEIKKARPEVLFVAFGAPKQEYWIDDQLEELRKLGVKKIVGCGGSIDFLSGKVKRAPKIVQKFCLEGVFRFICEPNKIRFKRLILSLKVFRYL